MTIEYQIGLGEYLDEMGILWENASIGNEQAIRILEHMTDTDVWNLAMAYRNWRERFVDEQP